MAGGCPKWPVEQNVKPLEIWKSQGTGIGLPLIIPISENPRGDKALMDQLVDSGSRTIKGIAAVNGLALRRMQVGRDVRDQVSGFEEAAAEMEPVMKAVRELDIQPHFEMESGKLQDTFSIFKRRMGSKEDEESETTLEEEKSEEEEPKENDDEADFDVTDDDVEFEEEKDEEEVQPDELPEPVWPDIMNGPLRADGPFEVEPYTGEPRFPYAAVWPVRKPKREILPKGLGIRMVYQHKHGHFTTVTRVVAATPGGLPKVIISNAVEALPKIQEPDPEPWKVETVRNLMRLSRLRVGTSVDQLLMFGFSSTRGNDKNDWPADQSPE